MNSFDQMWYEYQSRNDRKSNAAIMIGFGLFLASVIGLASLVLGVVV